MDRTLHDLNHQRTDAYRKSRLQEEFLVSVNKVLRSAEIAHYRFYPETYPTLFVFGLPRSGTTLLAQLLIHSFDVGYIDNLAARFWLAPVTGIRLSRAILGSIHTTDFTSHYAATRTLADIHEFGYFWRHWLHKESIEDFVRAKEREEVINWTGLRQTLLNMQHAFDKPMLFKNIFGAYHIERFLELLSKAVFVYIDREPVDVAISLLKARSEFYNDLALWWSTMPPEYPVLKDLPVLEQIAGQVYYLRRLYERQIEAVRGERVVRIDYRNLAEAPSEVVKEVESAICTWLDIHLPSAAPAPASFVYRQHLEDKALRATFASLLDRFAVMDKG